MKKLFLIVALVAFVSTFAVPAVMAGSLQTTTAQKDTTKCSKKDDKDKKACCKKGEEKACCKKDAKKDGTKPDGK